MTSVILQKTLAELTDLPEASAILASASVVPPSWPLDRWIAVNPWWGVRHLPAERASQLSGVRQNCSLFMPLAFYRDAWNGGRIRREDLAAAISQMGAELREDQLIKALDRPDRPAVNPVPLMLDQSSGGGRAPALDAVREQVSRACGLFFDEHQSRGFVRGSATSLFESWLEQGVHDLAIGHRTGLREARKYLRKVPKNYVQATEWAIKVIALPFVEMEQLAHRLLFELVGWASWCRGVDWREELEHREGGLADQFLAILLVWEAIAVESASQEQRHSWQRNWRIFRKTAAHGGDQTDSDLPLWLWHRAYELGYQRQLGKVLFERPAAGESGTEEQNVPDFQAVFCIDVRSEVIRRHLEASCPGAETLGFAGFFGMPIAHQTLDTKEDMPRLPGLLAPAYRLVDSMGGMEQDRKAQRTADSRESVRQSVRKSKYSSFSSFTLVESTGLAWAWKLLRDSLHKTGAKASGKDPVQRRLHLRLGGDPVSDHQRVQLAEGLLRGMSLTSDFAPLLVFVGHGSHSDNNPHAASLACGACGGQNGGLNASVAADLINDRAVRAGLVAKGIRIPDFTIAIAAEHCTVTDSVTILDREQIPDVYLERISHLEQSFSEAGQRTRRERAAALALNGASDESLLQALVTRTSNWSEVRPEWGLANNAAIIFAKRTKTRGVNLQGRAFLHDYDPALDTDGTILEGLMTAPMIVANWINLQYQGSVAAPETFGAGNKLLHSVVGGNIGVVEGNDPDLRIGLALQSVHDGQQWRHEPVRLHVLIDAPANRIEDILAKQPDVARLVENRWLWLFRWGEDGLENYRDGQWLTVQAGQQGCPA